MELITLYNANRHPVDLNNIDTQTFHKLKRNGWYTDSRTNLKFTMLNKRIKHDNKWYRVLVRFGTQGKDHLYRNTFQLSSPCPFLITECIPMDEKHEKWKDVKTYHGPKMGSVSGYLQNGLPYEVINEVNEDLVEYIVYA
ncbi:hypothetical protein [Bacillus cereus group sp. BfR-BA-01318]|uniref:hypothetical protein n=1 Tax=unclassified Bacillus cereus group TaxID=2750818 RepID=UPI001298D24A|nr:hypothetical protein [Bacillus cereus group sp. BfR-BA-01318]MEB9561552.1 hypothetical protein [Bacillus cereus]MRC02872.1 hypothetical protein [Bacillus thuringiensis]MRC76540.1 hypothetical protein [Bacillus thuringiensis]MRD18513.1 hypothetical protein [Bacillus thuringiensis]